MRQRLAIPLAAALAFGLGACERADQRASDTGSTTLTVYAGLPLQGPEGPGSQAVADGARLALREAGGTVGGLIVKLAVLDDATSGTGGWNRTQTADNARTVVRDNSAIAYLGDGPSGATAISLPLLNEGGVPQVSPSSSYPGLTRAQDAGPGEPERFLPSGTRTFARVAPAGGLEARALLSVLRPARCRRLALLGARGLAGRGVVAALRRLTQGTGLRVVAAGEPRSGEDPGAVARTLTEKRPDCAVVAGESADGVAPLLDALHAAAPRLRLFGGVGPASDAVAAVLSAGAQARVELVGPAGVLEPTMAMRTFARRYRAALGTAPTTGSVYGYEAMQVILAAIAKAGPHGADRAAVGRALFGLGPLRGPLGPYRIDPAGDTTSTAFTRYGVRAGRLVRRGVVAP